MNKKIVIIINIISPNRVFLFEKIKKHLERNNVQLKVFFLSYGNKVRHWKFNNNFNFDFEILKNITISLKGKKLSTFFINPQISNHFQKENPDKIISFGWNNWASYVASNWCKKNKKEFILWSGSTKYEKSWRRTLFHPLVKYILKKTDNFIAYGTRAKEYLISLGINPKKIQIIYNTVDIDYFREKSKNFSEEKKAKFKKELGIKTDKILLFSGQLIERKGVFELLEGFKKYQKIDPNISLLILGKGQEKKKMEKIIQEKSIHNVVFANFVQYNNLYKYYSISDLLILPSREEVWGLVLNEAMACGLPVITTHETGASVDLVEEDKNGYVIPSDNFQAIAGSIQKVFSNNLHKDNNSWQIVQKTRVEDILKEVKI
jgi:glycosyltransferase involved in cell wall biosynthesis